MVISPHNAPFVSFCRQQQALTTHSGSASAAAAAAAAVRAPKSNAPASALRTPSHESEAYTAQWWL
jgi:hypothetical protein